jgi:hypothetical protein
MEGVHVFPATLKVACFDCEEPPAVTWLGDASALREAGFRPSMFFGGPPGCGKTTAAMAFARGRDTKICNARLTDGSEGHVVFVRDPVVAQPAEIAATKEG